MNFRVLHTQAKKTFAKKNVLCLLSFLLFGGIVSNISIAQVAPETWMPDAALRTKVRARIGLQPDVPLTQQVIAKKLGKLDGDQGGQVSDLTGLEYATALNGLNLKGNKISDLTPLAGLSVLIYIVLSDNQIRSIAPLASLSPGQLFLDNNQISDLTPLETFSSLKILSLKGNQISDVKPLEGLTGLKRLYLEGNQISDWTPLRNLKTQNPNIEIDVDVPTNTAPVFTDGDTTTRSVEENTRTRRDIGLPVSATDVDSDTLKYSLGGTDADAFSIDKTTGQLLTHKPLDYETKTTYVVTITVSDGNGGTDSVTVTINITNVDDFVLAGRTRQIQDAIVATVPNVDSAAEVTAAHLAVIRILDVENKSVTALKSGDFDGLTALELLNLTKNDLTALPAGIFDKVKKLTFIALPDNALASLPAGVFDKVKKLTYINLSDNALTSLPAGIFGKLTKLKTLDLSDNALASLPAGVFDKSTRLTFIDLSDNALASLPAGVFDKSTRLTYINLSDNALTALPAGVFDKLTKPKTLDLADNKISDLSAVENLTSLRRLYIGGNPIADYGPLRRLTKKKRSIDLDITIPVDNSLDITIPIDEDESAAPALPVPPAKTSLLSNYPNPFNPETWIPYELSRPAQVTVTIYNIQGVVVRELALGHKPTGVYRSRSRAVHWDGRNASGEKVATGVYFYTFTAGDYTATRKMLIRK